MYRTLITEITSLANSQKTALLSAYQHLFTNTPLACSEYSSLPYGVIEDDTLVAVFGLDTRETSHQLIIDNTTLYTWCIWDAFFIAEALQLPAQIITTDPVSKQELTAQLIAGQWSVDSNYWVSFPENSAKMQANLRGAFCSFVQLFDSEQTATALHANTGCGIYPVETLLLRSSEMAQAINPTLSR